MTDTILDFGGLEAFTTHRAITLIRARQLASDYDLKHAFKYFWERNTSAGLSYHNRYHACWLMVKVDEMGTELQVPGVNLRALVLAAMFHDMNHSGGTRPDSENIEEAMEDLEYACEDEPRVGEDTILRALELIRVTEFPFIRVPKTLEEKIIRDADILQGCTPHFAKTIYVDLYQELLVSKPDMKFLEYVEGQKQFLASAEMFTEIGKQEKKEFIEYLATPFWERIAKWEKT